MDYLVDLMNSMSSPVAGLVLTGVAVAVVGYILYTMWTKISALESRTSSALAAVSMAQRHAEPRGRSMPARGPRVHAAATKSVNAKARAHPAPMKPPAKKNALKTPKKKRDLVHAEDVSQFHVLEPAMMFNNVLAEPPPPFLIQLQTRGGLGVHPKSTAKIEEIESDPLDKELEHELAELGVQV